MALEDFFFQAARNGVTTLADGEAIVLDCTLCPIVTIIPGAGCTATYSRVDSPTAAAHTTGTENGTTVAANTRASFTVDWPYLRISAAGGACRVWRG